MLQTLSIVQVCVQASALLGLLYIDVSKLLCLQAIWCANLHACPYCEFGRSLVEELQLPLQPAFVSPRNLKVTA